MVFVLPSEFRAPQPEDLPVAQLDLGPQPIIFEKPKEKSYKHLKGLYLEGFINGKPVSRMLVDTGAAVNLMPYSVLRRLGRSSADLIKTNVRLNDFNGQPSEAMGVLNVVLTVGHNHPDFVLHRQQQEYIHGAAWERLDSHQLLYPFHNTSVSRSMGWR